MPRQKESYSFYFFDFDDNSMFLETPVFVKNTKTGEVIELSTAKFAKVREELGKTGDWEHFDYFDDSYRHFRDIPAEELKKGQKQYFVEDIEKVLQKPENEWQGPAWNLLQYACKMQRPAAFITARGHSRETIMAGVQVLVDQGHLDDHPKYLGIYAVSNDEMVEELLNSIDDEDERERIRRLKDKTSALKRIAIHNIVEQALEIYGKEPFHRFGMSDDDPTNIDLIVKAMCDCKKKYMDKRFFVINTHHGEHVKLEVFPIDYPVTRQAEPDEIIG